jgi:DNA topoisomerase-3
VVKENYRRFACTGQDGPSPDAAIPQGEGEGCGFSITKIPAGRSFELHEVEAFCATRRSARWKASAPRPAGPSRPS